jgi:two-component system response regulator AtoC
MNKGKILIIDDEPSQLELLRMFLSRKGYIVKCTATASEGIEADKRFAPDVIILDIHLPDMDGLEALQCFKEKNPKANIIMITAYHDMETTVKAMKLGAYEYITKPIDVEELEKAITRALSLSTPNVLAMPSLSQSLLQKGSIIGSNKSMQEIFKVIGVLCEKKVTVLIEGETGTGKELIAKAIHYYGSKKDSPFIAINCSAIVGTLLESELFGHEKGAFTGAFF